MSQALGHFSAAFYYHQGKLVLTLQKVGTYPLPQDRGLGCEQRQQQRALHNQGQKPKQFRFPHLYFWFGLVWFSGFSTWLLSRSFCF